MCNFSNLVRLDLRYNELSEIGNISCLLFLDTLNLSYNRIYNIRNDTFNGLSYLRVLNVAHNGLKTLEPAAITGTDLQIFHADFSHNNLKTVEFSNMVSETDFCSIDFTSNKIKEIVNTNNFKIDLNKIYHGGSVELIGNRFSKFIDFEKLGISEISILGKVFEYGFIMSDAKWDCDCHIEPFLELAEDVIKKIWRDYLCHIEPFLELAEDVIKKIWRDYFNMLCWNPPEYRGRNPPEYRGRNPPEYRGRNPPEYRGRNPPEYRGKVITDIVKEDHLDVLICNLTNKDKCPKNCYCFYQPKEKRTVFNCTNAGLTQLPVYIPEGKNLILILKNNSIENLENRTYLGRISVLDISNNKIQTIKPGFVANLPKDISLSLTGNKLTTLPREIQTLNPCRARFGKVMIDCNCKNIWIKDWINNRKLKQCRNISMYFCRLNSEIISAEEVSIDDMCEKQISYTLLVVLSVLSTFAVVVSSLLVIFRYECILLKRKYFVRKSGNDLCTPIYDAFISFNEENDKLRQWILNILTHNLEVDGYRIFVPCRDLIPGTIKEEQLLENIKKSKTYLMLLCDEYKMGGLQWIDMEWKYIWHYFRNYLDRNILVINYDYVNTYVNIDPRLRAFLRLGYDIDFSNRKHKLIKKLKKRLGLPLISSAFGNRSNRSFINFTYLEFVQRRLVLNHGNNTTNMEHFVLPGAVGDD
ncbi:unnamed protein product [Mytilus coruscus]|uniref:TIR domain-containing protein n=1 Tax=Mytilus coruscus TaxID=42192 RepID=A0A6J8DP94_MYTCO|nr:unnamed protein product [Mytilus coruscus]